MEKMSRWKCSTISVRMRTWFVSAHFVVATKNSRLSTPVIHVFFVILSVDILAIDRICRLRADLTTLPNTEFERRTSPDGRPYYKMYYSIRLTFRNSITFELIYKGKVYQSLIVKY